MRVLSQGDGGRGQLFSPLSSLYRDVKVATKSKTASHAT
jgi:hypothetical protein